MPQQMLAAVPPRNEVSMRTLAGLLSHLGVQLYRLFSSNMGFAVNLAFALNLDLLLI